MNVVRGVMGSTRGGHPERTRQGGRGNGEGGIPRIDFMGLESGNLMTTTNNFFFLGLFLFFLFVCFFFLCFFFGQAISSS